MLIEAAACMFLVPDIRGQRFIVVEIYAYTYWYMTSAFLLMYGMKGDSVHLIMYVLIMLDSLCDIHFAFNMHRQSSTI